MQFAEYSTWEIFEQEDHRRVISFHITMAQFIFMYGKSHFENMHQPKLASDGAIKCYQRGKRIFYAIWFCLWICVNIKYRIANKASL